MYLIVKGCITDRACHFIADVLQVKLRHRIIRLDGHRRITVHPDKISQPRISSRSGTSGLNRTCRIIAKRVIYDAFIDFLIILIRHFQVQINREMIIKKLGRNTSVECKSLIVIGTYDTVLIGISNRKAIRSILLHFTRYRKVVFLSECRPIDFILPVSRCRA